MNDDKNTNLQPRSLMIRLSTFFVILYAVGVIFYHTVEGLRIVDAIYFTAITLTTVGYGEIAPATDAGKLFTSVYVFLGVVTFLGFAAVIFETVLNRFRDR